MVLAQMADAGSRVAPLTAAELARARSYLYGDLLWGTVAQVWMLAVLAWFWFSGWTRAWTARMRRCGTRPWLVRAGVTVGIFTATLVLVLPFDFYLGWVRERGFGFQHLSAAAWLGQWAESSALTTAAAVVVVGIAYGWLNARRGPTWWLRLWIVVSVGVVVAVAVQPVVIAPLFNRYTPIRNAAVRAEIEGLARRAGIPNAKIEEMDASRQSAHTNAFVVGILGSQRIVVYDTLLQSETPAEIAFTVGHEIGHYVLRHIWKGVGFTVALLLGFFALLGWLYPKWSGDTAPREVAGLPLMLLILLGLLFLAAPASNGFSRWEEHQADAFGLRLSARPCAAVAGFEREEHTDLMDPDPPGWVVFWYFNHPSQQERIDFASSYCNSAPTNRSSMAPAGGGSRIQSRAEPGPAG